MIGFAGLAAGLLGLVIATLATAAWRLGRSPGRRLQFGRMQPVSIVVPLCGLEWCSEETLRSAFRLAHGDYELLFCVASSADPILPLLTRYLKDSPVPARVLVGDDRISTNPKLNNCLKGWEAARHSWIILADSNVLMPPDYVARMLAGWRTDTGLVCSTPIGTRPAGFAALLECAFLNTFQARWQYAGEALGLGFAQGKSMLWYRPFLDARGGLRALGAEMAEDAAATKLVRGAGLRVHLVDRPFEQPLGHRRLREVWARQLRWARLRRVTFPAFFAPELLTSSLLLAATLVACLGGSGAGWALAGGLLATCYGAEWALAARAGWYRSTALPLAFLLRDLLIPAVWASAYLTRTVVWRGNAMRIEVDESGLVEAAGS